jgi:hypothetical protein
MTTLYVNPVSPVQRQFETARAAVCGCHRRSVVRLGKWFCNAS